MNNTDQKNVFRTDGVANVREVLPVRIVGLLTAILIAIGVLARLSPLISDGRLFWQYMTEDGYLMQTVARNMAIGLGMSTAEGTIATNGVQPLATFLFAGLHFLAGGSKSGGIALVTAFSAIVSLMAAYFFYRVGTLVLANLSYGRHAAMLIAALWFSAPQVVPASMNGLETGVYYAAVLGVCMYYLSITADNKTLGWKQRFVLGILLGTAFLARNDAVFFIGILLLAHLAIVDKSVESVWSHRLADCMVAGSTSIVIATPWLVFNYELFGSIIPISGIAESHGSRFGENLHLVPAKLLEVTALYLPIPDRLEKNLVVVIFSLGFVAVSLFAFWYYVAKKSLPARRFFVIGLGMTLFVSGYYGLFFGAPHFLPRYFSILSPFLWTATVAAALEVARLWFKRGLPQGVGIVTAALAVMAAGFAATAFAHGETHMHRQVAEWVNANVPEDNWVGAIQTGTLGYFHDRTINLDGKVNPAALQELLTHGHILDYVVNSKINYLVDWVGIADWATANNLSPEFTTQFQLLVKDEEQNLAALRRIHPRVN